MLRVPVQNVKAALSRLTALGTIVSQNLSVTDLQHDLQVETAQIAELRRTIAALTAALRSPSLPDAQRVILQIRLANAKCDVLKGQCIRSNAGLYYESYAEFHETLRAIEQNRWLAGALGRNGRQFFKDQYDWPVIERKYLDMFARLKQEPPRAAAGPLPGWFDRRRQDLPPATEVLAKVPTGPAVPSYEPAGRRRA